MASILPDLVTPTSNLVPCPSIDFIDPESDAFILASFSDNHSNKINCTSPDPTPSTSLTASPRIYLDSQALKTSQLDHEVNLSWAPQQHLSEGEPSLDSDGKDQFAWKFSSYVESSTESTLNVVPARSSPDKPPSPQRQTCILFTRRQAKNDPFSRSPVKILGKEKMIKVGSPLEGGTATDRATYIIGLVTKQHQNPMGRIDVQLIYDGEKERMLYSGILGQRQREMIALCPKKDYKYGIIVPIKIRLFLNNRSNISAIIKVTVGDLMWVTSKFKIRPWQIKSSAPRDRYEPIRPSQLRVSPLVNLPLPRLSIDSSDTLTLSSSFDSVNDSDLE